MPKPTVTILREKKSGDYLLVHYAVHPRIGASVGWGQRDKFSADVFRKSGVDAILKSLYEYSTRKNADKQTNVFRVTDPKDQLKDAASHLSVGVRIDSPSELILAPMHRERGGYVGQRNDEIQLKLPITPEEFFKEVERAFEKCS